MQTKTSEERLAEYLAEKDRQERLEHRDVLLAIGAVIKTKEGQQIFEYLFKHFEIAALPPRHETGEILHEHLGFLRAGNSIYKLVCEAASESAASILAKTERKRYDDAYHKYRIDNGLYDD